MAVKPIPDGYHTVTPYMIVPRAGRFIDFVKEAFGATVSSCMTAPDGSIRHGEIRIGDSMIMIAEANDKFPAMPIHLYLYVPDVDAVYKQALKAGAKSIAEPTNQFYGDRGAGVADAFGNTWWLGTHIEDVADEEIKRRAAAHTGK